MGYLLFLQLQRPIGAVAHSAAHFFFIACCHHLLFDMQHAGRIDEEVIGRFALADRMALAELGIVDDVQGFWAVFEGVFGI